MAKYGPDGSFKWTRHFQNPSTLVGPVGVIAAPDGSVLVTGAADGISDLGGGVQGPSFAVVLAKYSSSGDYQFEKRFATTGPNPVGAALHIVADDSGNITLAGETQAAVVDFGGGPLTHSDTYDVFVVKLRPDGSYLWGQRMGSPSRDFVYDLAIGKNGHFAAVGAYRNSLDVGGTQLPGTASTLSGYLTHFLP